MTWYLEHLSRLCFAMPSRKEPLEITLNPKQNPSLYWGLRFRGKMGSSLKGTLYMYIYIHIYLFIQLYIEIYIFTYLFKDFKSHRGIRDAEAFSSAAVAGEGSRASTAKPCGRVWGLELYPKGPSIIMVYTYRVFWWSKYIP